MMDLRKVSALVAALVLSGQANAVEPGQWGLGLYAGMYQPEPSIVDDDVTYGVRLGYRIDDHWSVSGSLGFLNLSGDEIDAAASETVDADFDFTFLDLDLFYAFNPDSRFVFTIGGGVGYAMLDGEVKVLDSVTGNLIESVGEDDSLTLNLMIGPVIKLTDSVFLRIMSRFRYFEDREDDEIDREFTAAIVFPLGG